jgi:hypothetical protein
VKGKAAIRRGFATAMGFVALAAVPVLALNSLATADTGAGVANAEGGTGRSGLAGTARQCLADQGVALPTRPADGTRPTLSPEQRQALRQAAAACGLARRPAVRFRPMLTEEQRRCLADQGVTLPTRPADGTRPTPSPEQRETLRQAAAACGLPGRGPGADGAGPAAI